MNFDTFFKPVKAPNIQFNDPYNQRQRGLQKRQGRIIAHPPDSPKPTDLDDIYIKGGHLPADIFQRQNKKGH